MCPDPTTPDPNTPGPRTPGPRTPDSTDSSTDPKPKPPAKPEVPIDQRTGKPKTFGVMSEYHWSKARQGTNEEALEHYRQRSQKPGVREGGAERNFYCMECQGVIPFADQPEKCPHCGAEIEGKSREYFNWVEIDEPPNSDLRALLPILLVGLGVVGVVLFFLVRSFLR